MTFNLEVAGFEIKPSDSCPLRFCVADAGIESTPFEREGRAMVTRGAGAGEVMAAGTADIPAQEIIIWSAFSSYALPLLIGADHDGRWIGLKCKENVLLDYRYIQPNYIWTNPEKQHSDTEEAPQLAT